MERQTIRQGLAGYGYDAMVWVRDAAGHELSCSLQQLRQGVEHIEDLTPEERRSCIDVNQLIGTERW
jgi:hypothetical protein